MAAKEGKQSFFLVKEPGMRMWSENVHKKEGSLKGTKHGEFISDVTILLL
jgi:hypothetical protein